LNDFVFHSFSLLVFFKYSNFFWSHFPHFFCNPPNPDLISPNSNLTG
jgi:hypothetical protein